MKVLRKPRQWLITQVEASRRAGLPAGAERFPASVQRYFTTVSGFEPAEFVRFLLHEEGQNVLVVGVGAGRDAYWLALNGYQVTSIDITMQADIPRLVLADMAILPFRSAAFDAVIVADALEHTFEDRDALLEFRRVLTPTGAFVLNIPFGDDIGDHHVRVYTERTLHRLFQACGFRVEERVYRGALPLVEQRVPGAPHLFHALNLAVFLGRGAPLYRPSLRAMTDFDWRHGQRAWLRRLVRVHGAYIRARPVDSLRDFTQVNRDVYRNQARTVGGSHARRMQTRL